MKCIIISAGEISDYTEMRKYISDDDYIIAADGGYMHLEPLGVTCDYLLGDFDSLDEIPKCADEIYPSEKDDTDTMLAVKHGLLKGMDEFVILGGLGGRLDHTIANLTTLEYIKAHGARGMLVDENTTARVFGAGDKIYPIMQGKYFSVFPFGASEAVVSISGAKYPLDHYTLHSDFPLGASNSVTDPDSFSLTVHEGKILIIECKG